MPEKETKKETKYQLVKVPTGEAIAIESPTGEVMTQEVALVEILNYLKDIKTIVGGN